MMTAAPTTSPASFLMGEMLFRTLMVRPSLVRRTLSAAGIVSPRRSLSLLSSSWRCPSGTIMVVGWPIISLSE